MLFSSQLSRQKIHIERSEPCVPRSGIVCPYLIELPCVALCCHVLSYAARCLRTLGLDLRTVCPNLKPCPHLTATMLMTMLPYGFVSGVMGCTRTGNTDEVPALPPSLGVSQRVLPAGAGGCGQLPGGGQEGRLLCARSVCRREPTHGADSTQRSSALLPGEPCARPSASALLLPVLALAVQPPNAAGPRRRRERFTGSSRAVDGAAQ